MRSVARVVLSGLAILHGAAALRKRRAVVASHAAEPLPIGEHSLEQQAAAVKAAQEPADCKIPGWLTNAARRTVNGALNRSLGTLDPANVTLHAFEHEINFLGCAMGLEMDASVVVAGFGGASVTDLNCVNEECLRHDGYGCVTTDWTFEVGIAFGQLIEAGGAASASFGLCGLNSPNGTIDIGVDSANPGAKVSIVIQSTGFSTKISGVKSVNSDLGELHNFACDFGHLPGFIEGWCTNIITWLAGQVQGKLMDTVDNLLLNLVNTILVPDGDAPAPPPPAPAPTPAGECPWHGCIWGCGKDTDTNNCKNCDRCQKPRGPW